MSKLAHSILMPGELRALHTNRADGPPILIRQFVMRP